jgi:hypothetical protein
MTVVGCMRLLAAQTEGLEDRDILHREQDGVLMGVIRMLMLCPWRCDEKAAGLPGEALTVDDRITLSREDVIDGAIRLSMRPGVHA